ncbi:MAG TPA: hypothetical protein VMM57_06405 [Bacteroidota bacterium]|nr:hypothetical protein [Bacteroidota bacterium]
MTLRNFESPPPSDFNAARFLIILLFSFINVLMNSWLIDRPMTWLIAAVSFVKIAGVIVLYELFYILVRYVLRLTIKARGRS